SAGTHRRTGRTEVSSRGATSQAVEKKRGCHSIRVAAPLAAFHWVVDITPGGLHNRRGGS
ncbi:MAG: hypothetical protein ACJ78Q_15535, partial [Chloroflexia bacterium]